MTQFYQGDIQFKSVNEIPDKAKERKESEGGLFILAHGEQTGHHHAVVADPQTVRLYDLPDGGMLLEVLQPAIVQHQEHGEIVLPIGLHYVLRQQEYEYGKARKVAD